VFPVQSALKDKYLKRNFLVAASLGAVVLALVRFFLLPRLDNSVDVGFGKFVAEVTIALLAALITTVAATLLITWLTPPEDIGKPIEVIPPTGKQIPALLKQLAGSTSTWRYSGGTGTYLRAATMPRLANSAVNESRTIVVEAVLLDPRDRKLCDEYAKYRSSGKSGRSDREWTSDRVRYEVLATLISAFIWRQHSHYCEFRIKLKSSLSHFRYDWGDDYVVVTTEDPDDPALKVARGTPYHRSHGEDLRWNFVYNSKELPASIPHIIRDGNLRTLDSLEDLHIGPILTELGLCDVIDETAYPVVKQLIQVPKNRYE
jgi:hypothetical protein